MREQHATRANWTKTISDKFGQQPCAILRDSENTSDRPASRYSAGLREDALFSRNITKRIHWP
jgi:hypothetical protein